MHSSEQTMRRDSTLFAIDKVGGRAGTSANPPGRRRRRANPCVRDMRCCCSPAWLPVAPGRRRELAGTAAHHGRPVRGWRRHRCARAHPRAAHLGDSRPAGDHRERRRCRRNGRLRACGEGGAGRLPIRSRQSRRCHQPDALQKSAIQSRDRSRARGADRGSAHAPGGAQRFARGQPRRIHRLRAGEPGDHANGLGRRRLHGPSRLHAAQRNDRDQRDPRSLPWGEGRRCRI